MSASGQKQTYAVQHPMSALPPIATAKADMCQSSCLLHPRKRTCAVQLAMSAKGQKPTCAVQEAMSALPLIATVKADISDYMDMPNPPVTIANLRAHGVRQ